MIVQSRPPFFREEHYIFELERVTIHYFVFCIRNLIQIVDIMSWFTLLLIIPISYGLIYFADASLVKDIAEWNLYKVIVKSVYIISAEFILIFVMNYAFCMHLQRAHSKHYDNIKDDLYHMHIFLEHKLHIEEHNHQYEDGLVSFRMGYSKYTDIHNNHLRSVMNGYKGHHNHQ